MTTQLERAMPAWVEPLLAALEKPKATPSNYMAFALRMLSEGEQLDEIAYALCVSPDVVAQALARAGVNVEQKADATKRWRRLWLSRESDQALHKLAHDGNLSVPEMLERMVSEFLSYDAEAARRLLGIKRKAKRS